MSLLRRVSAVLAILALGAGNVAVCAGWQVTPEARMACCNSAASCPMHAPESGGADSRSVTQLEADSCCAAASTRTESPGAGSSFTPPPAAPAVGQPDLVVPSAAPALEEWRALVPHPVPHVPRHLLLAVLLV